LGTVSKKYSTHHARDKKVMESSVLSVKGLKTYFFTHNGVVKAVDGVSFDVHEGEILGLVGESGSGKTATALSILNLLEPPGRIVDGTIFFEGEDLLGMSESEIRKVRGSRISMVFQDPRSFLSPYLTVGSQLMDNLIQHSDAVLRARNMVLTNRREIRDFTHELCVNLLSDMMIPDPERILKTYPHQLSGGMSQRIMIAMAIVTRPKIIIADEPTTNLDVTVQAQILELLKNLVRAFGASLVLITHDMGIVAQTCDRVAVMYAGQLVEYGSVQEVFHDPKHPYTRALIQASPRPSKSVTVLPSIGGSAPDLINPPSGCYFHPRCPLVFDRCLTDTPEVLSLGDRRVRCHLYDRK
jgi:peptide/nickel transport system ATP-binding protein